jgi:hypothetical protein
MMYSVVMALFDFVPVIGFLVGGLYCIKISRIVLKKVYQFLTIIGVSIIVLGGGLKASWKLMNAVNLVPPEWMSEGQFIFMAIGYLTLLIPVIALIRKQKARAAEALPAMAVWKIPLLAVMTLSSLSAYTLLAILSFRRKSWLGILGFIVAFISILAMGYMSSQAQTIQMQWVEQSINTLGTWGFALGSILLHKTYRS